MRRRVSSVMDMGTCHRWLCGQSEISSYSTCRGRLLLKSEVYVVRILTPTPYSSFSLPFHLLTLPFHTPHVAHSKEATSSVRSLLSSCQPVHLPSTAPTKAARIDRAHSSNRLFHKIPERQQNRVVVIAVDHTPLGRKREREERTHEPRTRRMPRRAEKPQSVIDRRVLTVKTHPQATPKVPEYPRVHIRIVPAVGVEDRRPFALLVHRGHERLSEHLEEHVHGGLDVVVRQRVAAREARHRHRVQRAREPASRRRLLEASPDLPIDQEKLVVSEEDVVHGNVTMDDATAERVEDRAKKLLRRAEKLRRGNVHELARPARRGEDHGLEVACDHRGEIRGAGWARRCVRSECCEELWRVGGGGLEVGGVQRVDDDPFPPDPRLGNEARLDDDGGRALVVRRLCVERALEHDRRALERRRTQLRQAPPAEADYSLSARKNNGSGYGVADSEVGGRSGEVVGEERVVAELVQRGGSEEVQEGCDGGEAVRVEAIINDGELEALGAENGYK
ncbi:hypothetical protein C8R44DRAFT_100644 [Mycena epipterygia]|nr:hypothetical protein C8R44DRAFT_100644 [Mycena epipterygia]